MTQCSPTMYCTARTEMKGQNQKEKVLHIQKSIMKIPTGFNPKFHIFYVYSPIQFQYQCASDKKTNKLQIQLKIITSVCCKASQCLFKF